MGVPRTAVNHWWPRKSARLFSASLTFPFARITEHLDVIERRARIMAKEVKKGSRK
jgi:hypothetical protein